jgi:hypothetical protein
MPLYQAYPSHAQQTWPIPVVTNVTLVTESNSVSSIGSCCDNGRMEFPDCHGPPWYLCKQFGLKDHKTWVQFGANGLHMPLSTEHKGVCTYSAVRQLCNIPDGCSQRIPSGDSPICGEMVYVSHK